MADPLYLALAILSVVVGVAISIPLARRAHAGARSAARRGTSTVPLSQWATPLSLTSVGPGEDARFPQGLLRGSRRGYEVQIFESATADGDGSPAASFLSVLVFGNRVYTVKAGGLASCFDAAKGQPLWEMQRIDNFGDYYASPIAADGKIYMAGRNGFIVVLSDSPELNVLAINDMNGEIMATPAIADGRLYIRTKQNLFCVGN